MQVAVHQMRIQTGGHFKALIAGIDGGQHFFGRQQLQARQQRRVLQHHLLHAVDGRDERLAGSDQRFVLAPRDETGTQERTDQAAAGRKPGLLHARMEFFRPAQIAVHTVLQELVIPDYRFVQLRHDLTYESTGPKRIRAASP